MVLGAGSFGREVAWLIQDINQSETVWNFMGFVDSVVKCGNTVEGYPVLGTEEDLISQSERPWFVVAIANSEARKRITEKMVAQGFPQATLIHPGVNRSVYNRIGVGGIICSGAILTTNVDIGENCIINLGCRIGHDTVLGPYCSLMPGTNLAGNVTVGHSCYFGLNACVINGKSIGERTTVGAGATVVNDIPADVVVAGVPAKVIRHKL